MGIGRISEGGEEFFFLGGGGLGESHAAKRLAERVVATQLLGEFVGMLPRIFF